jgi:hypothetical protein
VVLEIRDKAVEAVENPFGHNDVILQHQKVVKIATFVFHFAQDFQVRARIAPDGARHARFISTRLVTMRRETLFGGKAFRPLRNTAVLVCAPMWECYS